MTSGERPIPNTIKEVSKLHQHRMKYPDATPLGLRVAILTHRQRYSSAGEVKPLDQPLQPIQSNKELVRSLLDE